VLRKLYRLHHFICKSLVNCAVSNSGSSHKKCTAPACPKLVQHIEMNSKELDNLVHTQVTNGSVRSVGIATGYGLDGPGIE